MKIHTQSALIILATLILGILLGTVISTVFVHQRFQKVRSNLERGRFSEFMVDEVIQPIDEAQRELLLNIVEETSQKNEELILNFRTEMDAIMDSLYVKMKPLLTEEQYNRLVQQRIKRERGKPGPPFPPQHGRKP